MIFSLNEVKETKFGTLANAIVMCLGPAQIVNLDLEKVDLDIKVNQVGIDFAKLVRAMESSLKNPEEVGPVPPEQPVTPPADPSGSVSTSLLSIIDENLENPGQLHVEILSYMKRRDNEIKDLIEDIEHRVRHIDVDAGLDSCGLADRVEEDLDNYINDILNTSYIRNIVRDVLNDSYLEPELCNYDVEQIQDQVAAVREILID